MRGISSVPLRVSTRVAPAFSFGRTIFLFILTLSVTCLPNDRFGCRPHCKSFVAFCIGMERLCATKRALCGVHGRARTGNVCRVPPLASPRTAHRAPRNAPGPGRLPLTPQTASSLRPTLINATWIVFNAILPYTDSIPLSKPRPPERSF